MCKLSSVAGSYEAPYDSLTQYNSLKICGQNTKRENFTIQEKEREGGGGECVYFSSNIKKILQSSGI